MLEDGKIIPPYKSDVDGRYHIEWKLHVANRQELKQLVNTGERDTVILSPILPYMRKKCCNVEEHLVNKKSKSYLAYMYVAKRAGMQEANPVVQGPELRRGRPVQCTRLQRGLSNSGDPTLYCTHAGRWV
jgi:hypothetical protein